MPAELEAHLRQKVSDPLSAADHIHYLSGLGDEAIHDWGVCTTTSTNSCSSTTQLDGSHSSSRPTTESIVSAAMQGRLIRNGATAEERPESPCRGKSGAVISGRTDAVACEVES